MSDSITITVRGTPAPKPQMLRKTRYSQRDAARVQRYHIWSEAVRLAYREQHGKMFEEPVALTLVFKRRRMNCDLSNLTKSVEDALKGLSWKDDNVKWIPKYDSAHCLKVKRAKEEGLELRIRPLGKP